jgi:hypothetical protein
LREECRLRVFENRVLRRIFGPKMVEVTGEWRKLHNEKLNDLYCSPHIIQVIKLRRMKLAGNVARMGKRRGVYRVLVGKPEEGDHLEDPSIDGRILRWIFRTWDVGGMDLTDLVQDRDRWQALVHVVITFSFHKMWAVF